MKRTPKRWGYYTVIYKDKPNGNVTVKSKKIFVEPNSKLSLQRHNLRNEVWVISKGTPTFRSGPDLDSLNTIRLSERQKVSIDAKTWHQLINDTDDPVELVEIQYGEECNEFDIERSELTELEKELIEKENNE